MAARYWMGGTGTWDTTTTANWSATFPILVTASCSGTTLTTIGSPALVVGNTVRLTAGGTSLGTITGGSGNIWTVSVGGTYAQQSMVYATVGASVPTTTDATTFTSFTGVTVTLSGALNCAGINGLFTGTFDGTGTINFGTAVFSIQNTVTWSATGLLTFTGNTTMTTNGVTINSPITNTTGTFTLGGALTLSSGNTFTLTSGTLSLASFTLTTGFFSSSNANVRAISFGTGNITLNGAGGTLWDTGTITSLTTTGTQVVNVSYSGAVATTVSSGSLSEVNSISFNFTTGTYSLTHTAGSKRNLNFTGFAGTVSNTAQTIYGNLTLASGATYTAGANSWSFAATSAGKTITSNGKTMDFPLTFSGSGGSWVLQDALTMGSTRILNHARGTIDLNGKTLTVGSQYAITTAGSAKNLTFNGGTLICPAASASAFNNSTPADFTTTAGTGTGTISMTAATAKTFVGGGSTFNCTLNQGGAGALTITDANTFDNITNTVQPASILFTAGTTTTFNNFNLNGTAGNLITIASATAATHTLSKASGTVSCDYLSITNSIATGGASWYAGANSTNVSGNTGWIFTAPGVGNTGAFFSII